MAHYNCFSLCRLTVPRGINETTENSPLFLKMTHLEDFSMKKKKNPPWVQNGLDVTLLPCLIKYSRI